MLNAMHTKEVNSMAKKKYLWISQIPGFDGKFESEEGEYPDRSIYNVRREIIFIWDTNKDEISAVDVEWGDHVYKHKELIPVTDRGYEDGPCVGRDIGTKQYFKFYNCETCELLEQDYDTAADDEYGEVVPVRVLNPREWPWSEVEL